MHVNSIALSKQSLLKLSLRLSLDHIVYPHTDDKYSLFLFTSNSHPLLNTSISNLELNKQIKKSLCVTRKLPCLLHLWLFVTCKDSDQILTQTPLGMAFVRFSDLNKRTAIELIDIERGIQATGTVECLNLLQGPFQKPVPDTLSQYYIEKVWAAYDKTKYDHDQRFSYIETHMGRIPIISFPILATMIKADKDQAVRLFQRLLEVAKSFTSDDHELIGEMLTLIPRCLMYQPDTVRTANGGTKSVDQWSSLGCFPSLSLAGFDCEDGAKLILELFHLFKYTDCKGYEELQKLQKLVQTYTSFMCLGQLNLTEGPTPHCYVVLLDTRYIQREFTEYEPALVLEATNYTQSVWRKTETPNESAIRSYRILDEKVRNSREERIYKYKMPKKIVEEQNMYGPITALLSGDQHFLLGYDEKQVPMTVGISSSDLFYYKNTVKLNSVLKLHNEELKLFKSIILSEFPVTGIPFSPNSLLHVTKTVTNSLQARTIDLDPVVQNNSTVIAVDSAGLDMSLSTV